MNMNNRIKKAKTIRSGTMAPVAFVAAGVLGASTLAQAAVVGPIYPAPEGNSFSGSGSPGATGGRTNTYSGFDPADLTGGLYWGKSSDVPIQLSLNGGGYTGAETMVFSGVSGNVATWNGATSIHVWNGAAYVETPVNTRFTITTTDALSNPIAFTTPAAVDLDFPTAADAIVPVAGSFTAVTRFEVYWASTWQPAITLYNSLSTNPSLSTASSFGGAFYVVPEPAGLGLLALAGVAVLRRRRA